MALGSGTGNGNRSYTLFVTEPILGDDDSHGLVTDLYHPDAAYVAWRLRRLGTTTFDLYARRAPSGGAFILVAGLEPALDFVRKFRYSDRDLRYLAQVRNYDIAFLDFLGDLRFTGDIHAMPEGTIAFPNEPLVRVTAPFPEALLIEAGVLQSINAASWVATKAARITMAAKGRRVAEFALRRAAAPFTVARSAYIGGCSSTSFVAAAERYRLAATGTIPHALIQLFPDEREAFMAVAETFSRYTVLLDTYDICAAMDTVVDVARDVQERLGHMLAAVRLDSGDLEAGSRLVRGVLNREGLHTTRIIVSGDLDEESIEALVASEAPIDAFGVGTSLGTVPGSRIDGNPGGLGGVYKAVHYDDGNGDGGLPLVKLSADKGTLPGRKDVYRLGRYDHDVIQLEDEPRPDGGLRLLRPVILGGETIAGCSPPLSEIWEFAQSNLRDLPEPWRALRPEAPYPVRHSRSLGELFDRVVSQRRVVGSPRNAL
jgi:nicotinate phosphoribosyltransferase